MLANLVGYRPLDFTDDKGNEVKGTSLFVVFDDSNERGVVGSIAAKVFYRGNVTPDMVGTLVDLVYDFRPGMKMPRLVNVAKIPE